jgi:hypothetical protein
MPIIPISGSATTHGALIPIAQVKVTVANITDMVFSNIPQIYQDLYLVASARNNTGAAFTTAFVTPYVTGFGPTQSTTYLQGDSNAAYSGRYSNQGGQFSGSVPCSYSQEGVFGDLEMHVLSYASTQKFKTTLFRSTVHNGGAGLTEFRVGLTQTLSGINAINFSTNNGAIKWDIGTVVSLYGVRGINQ